MKKTVLIILTIIIVIGLLVGFQRQARAFVSQQFFEKGEKYFSHENYDIQKAEKLYKVSIFINNSQKSAHYQLGRIYFLNGNFSEAIAEFDRELANYPENKHPYYMRGLTNGYAKNYNEAIANFKEYISWNPKTWAGYNDLVWVYLLKKDYQGAEEASRKGLENSFNNPWLLSNLGNALLNQEKYQEAEETLILAKTYSDKLTVSDWLKVYPGNDPRVGETGLRDMQAIIQLNIATVLKRTGKNEEAKQEYQKYLDMLPENDKRKIPMEYFMAM